MSKTIKNDTKIWIAAAALICVFAAALIWGFGQRKKAEEYFGAAGQYMEATSQNYVRCAGELQDNVGDMRNSLAKLRVSASQSQTVLALEDVVKASAASVSIMSRLPRTHEATEQLMVFLVRTGDFARSLSRRVLAGETLPEADVSALESLFDTCTQLSDSLRAAAENGELPADMLGPSGYYADGGEGFAFTPDADSAETVPEYPTLIYDGPFSESTEKAEAKGLKGAEVSESEALAAAKQLTGAELAPQGVSPGKIPVYLFEGETASGQSVSAAVTQTGGRLLWFMRSGADDISEDGEGPLLPDEEEYQSLVSSASEFLVSCGYTGMTPSYSMYYNGMALMSFVWDMDGVRVYNDLIKVWLDRRDGSVIGLDANNYLFSHRERHIPAPVVTEAEARKLASPRLDIDAVSLALIPLTPSVEALCYEFHGYCGGEEYAVYINAVTGAEEQIFLILNDGNGKAAV